MIIKKYFLQSGETFHCWIIFQGDLGYERNNISTFIRSYKGGSILRWEEQKGVKRYTQHPLLLAPPYTSATVEVPPLNSRLLMALPVESGSPLFCCGPFESSLSKLVSFHQSESVLMAIVADSATFFSQISVVFLEAESERQTSRFPIHRSH